MPPPAVNTLRGLICREYAKLIMEMENIILISDPRVLQIPIAENGEPLVDLRTIPQVKIDHRKSSDSDLYFKIRKTLADKLVDAAKTLPVGIAFLVVEGYRPLSLQKRYFEDYVKELRRNHPDWNEQAIHDEASKFVAPPDMVPPHSTGGAIDLTLISTGAAFNLTLMKDGIELDMGTPVNADPEESEGACFTDASNISDVARANRQLLSDAMRKVGFVNYPTEWWHWSYGDRYWAYQAKANSAIYGAVGKVEEREQGLIRLEGRYVVAVPRDKLLQVAQKEKLTSLYLVADRFEPTMIWLVLDKHFESPMRRDVKNRKGRPTYYRKLFNIAYSWGRPPEEKVNYTEDLAESINHKLFDTSDVKDFMELNRLKRTTLVKKYRDALVKTGKLEIKTMLIRDVPAEFQNRYTGMAQ